MIGKHKNFVLAASRQCLQFLKASMMASCSPSLKLLRTGGTTNQDLRFDTTPIGLGRSFYRQRLPTTNPKNV